MQSVLSQSDRLPTPVPIHEPDLPPRFSEDIWRQIALFLPKRDLKSLLFVSNVLSRISSQLLFSEIDLHLTTAVESGSGVDRDVDTWHDRRSADILMQILVNPRFAGQVRNLSIFAVPYENMPPLAFKVGILMFALAKLSNLRRVHCSGNKELISSVLQAVHLHNPCLQRLSLIVSGHINDIEVPVFKHLTNFAIRLLGGNRAPVDTFLDQIRDTICSLSVKNLVWQFPAQAVSTRHLTQIEFDGCLTIDVFSEILDSGHQLESLMLSGLLQCAPSSLFRQNPGALSRLYHFSVTIAGVNPNIADQEFCPAISDFVRERTQLRTYHLVIVHWSAHSHLIGFNSSTWAVLPTLFNLSNLSITYPRDLPPDLAGWLIPRKVRALTLDLSPVARDLVSFMNQLRMGVPPLLYIGFTKRPIQPVLNIVARGFPNVRVVRADETLGTVTRPGDGVVGIEWWPLRRTKYYAADWLESLGCENAIWEGLDPL